MSVRYQWGNTRAHAQYNAERPNEVIGRYLNLIITQMHVVGMYELTWDNLPKFLQRLHIVDAATGGGDFGDTFNVWEPHIVSSFVGLTTNATPMTDAAFFKHVRTLNERTEREIAKRWEGEQWREKQEEKWVDEYHKGYALYLPGECPEPEGE